MSDVHFDAVRDIVYNAVANFAKDAVYGFVRDTLSNAVTVAARDTVSTVNVVTNTIADDIDDAVRGAMRVAKL